MNGLKKVTITTLFLLNTLTMAKSGYAADPVVTYGSLFEFYSPSGITVNDTTHFHVLQLSKSYAFTGTAAQVTDCVSKGQRVVADHSSSKLKIEVSGQTSGSWNIVRCAVARR